MKEPSRLLAWEESLRVQLTHFCPQHADQQWLIHCYDEVGSTMDLARPLAQEVTPEKPAIVLAKGQFKGRGRAGRKWESSKEALFMTLVFATRQPPAALSGASLLAGIVVRSVLAGYGCEVYVKWPNDLLAADGRKVGGILIEQIRVQGLTCMLCGIGVNLVSTPDRVGHAVSVAELCDARPFPLETAARIAPAMFSEFCLFREQGFFVFKDRFLACAAFVGSTVTLKVGRETLTGVFDGIGDSGALILRVGDETRELVNAHFVDVQGFTGSNHFC